MHYSGHSFQIWDMHPSSYRRLRKMNDVVFTAASPGQLPPVIRTNRFGHALMDGFKLVQMDELGQSVPAQVLLTHGVPRHIGPWLKMLSRRLEVVDFHSVPKKARRPFYRLFASPRARTRRHPLNRFGWQLPDHRPVLKDCRFLLAETQPVERWLHSRGFRAGEPLAVIHIRDGARDPHGRRRAHRNHSTSGLLPIFEYFMDQGYWIIRSGREGFDALPKSWPRVIDVPFTPEAPPELEYWAFASADIVVTSGSGPDIVARWCETQTLQFGPPAGAAIGLAHFYNLPGYFADRSRENQFRLRDPSSIAPAEARFFRTPNAESVVLGLEDMLNGDRTKATMDPRAFSAFWEMWDHCDYRAKVGAYRDDTAQLRVASEWLRDSV